MTKILVIEDEQSVRENILELLEAEGFDTIEAGNGHVGVTWAWEHKPDLIVCDVMMPELDGHEVLSLLRQDPATATMPFIFLTAKADKADIRYGMELGADDYLTKPFSKDELLGAIAARLKKQAALAKQTEQLLAALRISDSKKEQHHSDRALASDLLALKPAKFTGRFLIKSATEEWTLYFYQGRILYATGGKHAVRRWHRNLLTFCPQSQLNQLNLLTNPASLCWEYQLLTAWLKQEKISREQVGQIIRDTVNEVLFDILQAQQVSYEAKSENPLPLQLLLVDPEQALVSAQQAWQNWQNARLTDLLPNRAPLLKRPEALQQKTSEIAYRQLTALLDGQRTLRELALQMKRQVVEVAASLLPHVQAGIVELIDLTDLPAPIAANTVPTSETVPVKPTVACIDDSLLICQAMEKIVTEAGYQFVAVQDPLRAIATLLSRKPDLIFLDLVMPNLNGYEICTRLRQISAFHNTPIVILSGNIIDRVRAKVAGASDYLDKPIQTEAVQKLILKHLLPAASHVA